METRGRPDDVGRVVIEAVRAFALEPSLARIAEGARELTAAPYAAVGLPAGEPEEFSHFVTAGLGDEQIDAIGPLPRAHGLLGAVLADGVPLRVPDIRADPRARRWWPAAHPAMAALLGVPLLVGEAVVGAVYAARGAGEPPFDAGDEAVLGRLADAAAPVVRALRMAEDTRLLTLAAERARIARDLHDALSQSLFSIGLRADAARRAVAADPDRAAGHIDGIADLARAAREDLVAVVEGLRPPAVEEEGLGPALGRLAALLDRLGDTRVRVRVTDAGPRDPDRAREAFLILQEALVNAVRHARARSVEVELVAEGPGLRAEVRDDGAGFDPLDRRARARRMGLNGMRERAAAIGAELDIQSGPGEGTRVVLRLADG